jgi:hypothetical protein
MNDGGVIPREGVESNLNNNVSWNVRVGNGSVIPREGVERPPTPKPH